jgi:hypothetical protein
MVTVVLARGRTKIRKFGIIMFVQTFITIDQSQIWSVHRNMLTKGLRTGVALAMSVGTNDRKKPPYFDMLPKTPDFNS